MKISRNLKVPVDGAVFVFEPIRRNDWGVVEQFKGKDLNGQVDLVLAKLQGVEGLAFEDGAPITVEDIKAESGVLPGELYARILRLWLEAFNRSLRGEVEAGNGPTPDSSGSSAPGSTTA